MTRTEFRKQLVSVWDGLVAKLSVGDNPPAAAGEKDLFDLVEDARQEWQAAGSHFNYVTDPDLVDHAIHAMEAAERKYTYLLKKARLEGYRLPGKIDALRERRRQHAGS
ncbi:MAG: DUF2508 family protein [Bacillota bacterium]|nr:DUF2508 family protein [Bacillota bacterium]MDW7684724.1 DUF2508 family protein [Bacillota bacterium]